jgi:hypothetical protein
LRRQSIWGPPVVRVDPQIEKDQDETTPSLEPVGYKDEQDETDPISLFQTQDHQKAAAISDLKYLIPEWIRKAPGEGARRAGDELSSLTDPIGLLKGDYSSTYLDIPWFMPAAVLGGGLAGGAGYLGSQKLVDKLQNWKATSRLRKAREQYEKALAEERSRDKVGQLIDEVYEENKKTREGLEKEGTLSSWVTSLGTTASALAVLQALLDTAGPDSSRLPRSVWDRAQRAHSRQRLKENLPIYAISSDPEEEEPQAASVPGSYT